MKNGIYLLALFLFLTFAGIVISGGRSQAAQVSAERTPESRVAEVRKIEVAIKPDLYPNAYLDDDGNPAGYDIELAKLIDERLPQYEFIYVPLPQDAILLGVEIGKYPVAISSFAKSPEREEKYLFPSENIGAVTFGLVVRTENKDIDSLAILSKHPELKIEPIPSASQGQIIMERYNNAHPESPIAFKVGEWANSADSLKWLADKRYDAALLGVNGFHELLNKLGYQDKLVFNTVVGNKTWSLFHKGEERFAEDYSRVLKELKDEGIANDLMIKYFGVNLFEHLQELK
ncbi:MAG: transporter substrate-binding domain-containing protein [Synergistaceae bacterium]|nr:transporter substrate-binding domain-containing protein [Synergistaceae bacterium]